MNLARPLVLCCLSACLVRAQPANQTPIQSPPVIVQETLLSADAAGGTRIQVDETAPVLSRSMASLTDRVANLQLNAGGAGSFGDILSLRGLANTPYFSDPSVTLYFDDLPLGSTFAYPTGLFGFATSVVERGPQETRFGRGGEGGTILFSSAEPGAQPSGELRAGYGSYRAISAAADVRSARQDKGDATVSAAISERNGYIKNSQLNQRVDDQEVASVAARLRLRPTPKSEYTLQLLGTRHLDGAQPLVPLNGPKFTVARAREGQTHSTFLGGALKAAFDTDFGRLTATTSHTQWKLDPYDNQLVLPPALNSSVTQSQRAWNEELRLASTTKGPFTWDVGAWFSDGTTRGKIGRNLSFPFGLVPYEASDFRIRAKTQAVFGEGHLDSASGWKFTAGLRAESTDKTFRRSQTVPSSAQFTDSESFDVLLPKFEASYALDENSTVSASVSLGHKPGGWSAYTAIPALAKFKTERSAAFELGYDTSYLAKTLTFAIRGFVYALRDYQIERSFTQSDYLVVNAPKARSFGGEIETSWKPTPAWTFTGTIGVTNVTLREFTDPFTGAVKDGNHAPYAPDYDMHFSATYRLPSGWFGALDLTLVGKTYFDESQTPLFTANPHEIAAARLGYSTSRWRVALYGENLGDAGYYTLIVPGVGHAVPGAPRTYGFETAIRW